MSVLQLGYNAEKIAIVLTAIIKTMPNTLNSTKTTITLREKPSKKSSHESTKAVHVENQAVPKSTVNAIRPVYCVGIFANALNVRTMNHSVTKKSFLSSKETPLQPPVKAVLYVNLKLNFRPYHIDARQQTPRPNFSRLKPAKY